MLKKITLLSAIAGLLFSLVAVPSFAIADSKKAGKGEGLKLGIIKQAAQNEHKGQSGDNDAEKNANKELRDLNKALGKGAWIVVQSPTNPANCTVVPPGHLIAPGYKKTHGNPVTVPCNTLPPGIQRILSGTTTPPVLDTTAPVISGVTATSAASTTASIAWTTNEPATSKVYYGTTTPLSLLSALSVSNTTLLTTHTMAVSGLTASTTYRFVVESKDAAGNTSTTTESSFVTMP